MALPQHQYQGCYIVRKQVFVTAKTKPEKVLMVRLKMAMGVLPGRVFTSSPATDITSSQVAIPGLYRRALPSPPAIDFGSSQGKKLFNEALQSGTAEGFFRLISNFQTQAELTYCGLTSISMILNSLSIDPGRKWKGPWRWFDESMLDCCEPLEYVKSKGITFKKAACLACCAGAKVEAFHSNECTIDDFRKHVMACTSSEDCHMIMSYHRSSLKQTGAGHYSPLGGYHAKMDMALILDVARFKYPPHWVPLTLLWEAMGMVKGQRRGFMIISRLQKAPSLLHTMCCRCECWIHTAKYLMDDAPFLLKSEDVKTIERVLSVLLTSLHEFIKWIAEIQRQEDEAVSKEELSLKEELLGQVCKTALFKHVKEELSSKEELLRQVRKTALFKHVKDWILSANSGYMNNIPFLSEKDTLPKIASHIRCQGANMLAGKPGSRHGFCCTETCMKGLNANDETPVRMVSGTMVTDPSSCTGMYPASSDILTALLLALPPKTWFAIRDKNLLEEIYNLTATEDLPSLLQEEVLHLRRQLIFLSSCQEKKADSNHGEPSNHL